MLRFLVNPAAGGGRAKRHLRTLRRRAEELNATVEVSRDASDLTARARSAVTQGVERIVVMGGDGTAHLAVQGLAESDCALAILPIGRGNDLAASLGIPPSFDDALRLAVTGDWREIDLLRAGDRWFSFYGGVGFDSAVSAKAEAHPRWWPDSLTYILGVLSTVVAFRPPQASIEYDDGDFSGPVMFATACNGPRFGAGMRIAPQAVMDDGLMDLVIVRAISKVQLLRVFPRVYRGTHVTHPAVSIHRTRRVRLAFEPESLLGSDGEIVGSVGREGLDIAVHPRALRVIAPPAFGPGVGGETP